MVYIVKTITVLNVVFQIIHASLPTSLNSNKDGRFPWVVVAASFGIACI